MKSVAHMEIIGVPIDVPSLSTLKSNWSEMQDSLILKIDEDYRVFDGKVFKIDRWRQYVLSDGIPWPRLKNGRLCRKEKTFKEMAKIYPEVYPIWQLLRILSKMHQWDLAVGGDGRNRHPISPFSSSTGRNQPSKENRQSSANHIFSLPSWVRGLIKPTIGKGLAYIDWSQQEFGIAAALSRDELMMKAYHSGDSYIAFAIQAKSVPPDATKESHRIERGRFKICSLGVQYGMGSKTMALGARCLEYEAKRLIELHKQTYKRFWQWSDGVVNCAGILLKLWTVFGWEIKYPNDFSKTSAMNFPMQGNGADILRIACCLGTERGIKICAPIHDAILIEFDLENEESDIATMQEAMREASSIVLNGFELRTEVKIIRYPDRYMDERGQEMWDTVWDIIDKLPKE